MKKYFKLLVLLFLIFIPVNIYAIDLTCDETSHKIGDIFSCKITGNPAKYDKLSGTITSDASLSCKRANVSPGLEILTSSTGEYFDLSGTASTEDLVVISCEVLVNPTETQNAMVSVNDFAYHIEGSGLDASNLILKSDYIKIEHKEEEVVGDSKPRDISDPSVRPRKLVSKELNITFSQFITEYTVEVLFDTEEVTFDYELNDQTSSLRIEGDTQLQVGKNVIDIYITSADGSKEACYTFYVQRLARGEEIYYPESDSTLKSMVIPGYSIGFNQNTLEYKIHLTNDVNSVNINTIPNYEKATVSISNSDNLTNGDIIAVEVTSADETSKTTYKIFITKDAPKKDYSTIIITALLGVGFVGTIAMFIITNNKKKSDPLLSIKTNKRKVNKGKNFDSSVVPESNSSSNLTQETQTNEPTQTPDTNQVNTLNLNSENTVAPTQTDKVVVDSFNQATSVNDSINLTTNITPIQVTDNSINQTQSLVETANQNTEQSINQQVVPQQNNVYTQNDINTNVVQQPATTALQTEINTTQDAVSSIETINQNVNNNIQDNQNITQ